MDRRIVILVFAALFVSLLAMDAIRYLRPAGAAESYYQIPSSEGSGKKFRTTTMTTSTTVHVQAFVLSDGTNTYTATVNSDGSLNTKSTSTITSLPTLTMYQGTSPWVTSVSTLPTLTMYQGTSPWVTSVTTGTYSANVETRKQTPTGSALNVQIGPGDIISAIPIVQDFQHHQLHEGELFRWSTYVSSLGSGNSKDVQLVVPNITVPAGTNAVSVVPHLRFEVVSDSLTQFYLYESPTITPNGTLRTPINMERNGTYTSQLKVYEDPTVSSVGTTTLFQGITFSSRTSAGATDTSASEFVLKNNTTYLFRVTSGAAGAKVLIRFVWYEDLGV